MLKLNFQVSGSFKMKIQRSTSLEKRTKLCHATLDNFVDLGNRSRRSSGYQPAVWNHRLIESISSHYDKPMRMFSYLQSRANSTTSDLNYLVDSGVPRRRSADYQPAIWSHQFIESIDTLYDKDDVKARIEELKQGVEQLLKETEDPTATLELMVSIRRLGLAYHFQKEIGDKLQEIYVDGFKSLQGLKETALCFRLLREHGYNVSSDIFKKFKEGEVFMKCLSQDVKGLLSLYEATHLSIPGEKILEEAKEFCVKHLSSVSQDVDINIAKQVRRSLEDPTHWLIPRLETRYYIDEYEKEEEMRSCLLELAKLDFNAVQAVHQKEIKELSRWWEELDLVHKVDFSRDRIVEVYLWANGTTWEPKFSKCRKVVAKFNSVAFVIDDFYDIHATLEEAQLFTAAIRRWDLKAMEGLPDYLKLCYLAVHNLVNEFAYVFLKDFGFDIRSHLINEWIRLCEAYLRDTQYIHEGITPSLEEYVENGWISIGYPCMLVHAFYFVGHNFTEKSLDLWEHSHQLLYLTGVLTRLMDDLAPSKAEMDGLQPSAVFCRMKESGESYETAKKYIKDQINIYWKKLNEEVVNGDHPQIFKDVSINSWKTTFTMSQYGDGTGNSPGAAKDRVRSLFFEPIPME
ncbi:terpene synthase 10-like [Asparagus officinalis]|uniref:terpene synthase 10-like n=1 Tax=Asparagus officinalis TaxID=4686 RepID=UPI00098E60A7|nr:terpene synthase 10-like [Asparagus officinalis]